MNINILRYSLFGIARDQDVGHTLVKFIVTVLFLKKFILFSWPTVLCSNHSIMPSGETLNILRHFAVFVPTVLVYTIL